MGSFENQVMARAKGLKTLFRKGTFFKKGARVVSESCKKGWHRIKHIRG